MKDQNSSAYPVVRPPAWAGRFYPGDPDELRSEVDSFVSAAKVEQGPPPKAIIAPHAGYVYSGPVAGTAYAHLALGRDLFKRIILVGPSHRVDFAGLAASDADAWATPLGHVKLDRDAVNSALSLRQVQVLDQAHRIEHSLEVQLPFLQRTLDQFRIVPLLVGGAGTEEVCQVIEKLWDGPETAVVVSSDLSHYCDYHTARKMDQAASRAIEALRDEDLSDDQACGVGPIRGLLRAARARGLRVRTVDLRNSGDTAGPRHEVVGYGAYVFCARSD